MIEIHKRETRDGAIVVPPPLKIIREGADPQVGVRVRISPAVATEWLETRGDNRKVMQSVVDTYARDMKEERWLFNGAPIQFDEEGKLLNGQHRLWAVIESGCTIEAIIQWGIPRAAQATIDAGAKWQSKDILYMMGEKNTALLQATLKWIYRDETGRILSAGGVSNSKTLEILERHPNVRRSVDFMSSLKPPLYPSVSAFLHYKISAADPEKADIFFKRLTDGVELSETNPVYRLRERLGWGGKERIQQVDAMALAIIAWNAYRAGRSIQALIWRKNGPAASPFPTIDGAALGTTKVNKARARKPKIEKVPRELKPKTPRYAGTRREVASGGLVEHSRR